MSDQKDASATPRTREVESKHKAYAYTGDRKPLQSWPEFARQLETELASARREIAAQKVFEASYHKVLGDLEREIAALDATIDTIIKSYDIAGRLEEADEEYAAATLCLDLAINAARVQSTQAKGG